MLESTGFTFNNITSSSLGIISCKIQGGLFEENFIAPIQVHETVIRGREKPYLHDIQRETLTFKLTLAFENTYTESDIRTVARTFYVSQYVPITFDLFPEIVYYVLVTGDSTIFHNGLRNAYLELTLKTDSPYGYNFPITKNYNNLPASFIRASNATFENGTASTPNQPRYEKGKFANIITNGNFANGTTGWISGSANLSAINNVLSATGNGASSNVEAVNTTSVTCVDGKKVYMKCLARVTNAVATQLRVGVFGTTSGSYLLTSQATPVQNQWYPLSGVITMSSLIGNFQIAPSHMYADAATANGKVMEVKEVLAIDLTSEFGAGLEPSQATCDTLFATWFDDSRFGKGITIEEGTTNIAIANCDAGVAGWINYNGAVPTITTGQSDPFGGSTATRMQTTGGTTTLKRYYDDGTVPPNGAKRSEQIWIKNNDVSNNVTVASNEGGLTATVSNSEGWKKIKFENITCDGVGGLHFQLATASVATNLDVTIVRISVEDKAYCTSYITPQATRAAETLTIPTAGVLSVTEGTVEAKIKLNRSPGTNIQAIFDAGGTGATGFILSIDTSGKLYFQYSAVGGLQYSIGTTILQKDTWYSVACKWSTEGGKLFLNGVQEGGIIPAPSGVIFYTNAQIGSNAGVDRWIDGIIDDLRISSRARTDAEILADYNSNVSLVVDEWTTLKLDFDSTLQSENIYPILNDGDLVIRPELEIVKIGAGDVTVVNTTNSDSFTFSGIQNNEEIYLNCDTETIITNLSETWRYSSFSGDYLQLELGNNNIQITGDCNLEIRYEKKLLQS